MKQKTLAIILIALISFSFSACKKEEPKEEPQEETVTEETTTEEAVVEEIETHEPGEIPFDYPVVGTTAQEGDYILAPSKEFIDEAWVDSAAGESTTFIFYTATMIEPGEKESLVETLTMDQNMIPNSLIVPIKPGQTAEVGDVVLTWWQSGSGMIKAIVTAGGTEPTIKYLDTFVETEETIKPNSFHKLTGELEPGASVAVKKDGEYEHAVVINIADDKVLVSGFAGILSVENKSDLTPIPPTIEVNVGDTIMAPVIGGYDPVTVKEVKADIGQVVAEYEWAGEMTEDTFMFGEIIKELP